MSDRDQHDDSEPMPHNHLHRQEAPSVGEPADETPAEVAGGIAPPCDACGQRETAEERRDGPVTVRLCAECLGTIEDDERLSTALTFVSWLTPTQRSDLLAVKVAGETHVERAAEREVDPTTVGRSVSKALARIETVAEQEGEA